MDNTGRSMAVMELVAELEEEARRLTFNVFMPLPPGKEEAKKRKGKKKKWEN